MTGQPITTRIGLSLHCPGRLDNGSPCDWHGEGEIEKGEAMDFACPQCGDRLSVLLRSPRQLEQDAAGFRLLMTENPDATDALLLMSRIVPLTVLPVVVCDVAGLCKQYGRSDLLPFIRALLSSAWLMLHAN